MQHKLEGAQMDKSKQILKTATRYTLVSIGTALDLIARGSTWLSDRLFDLARGMA